MYSRSLTAWCSATRRSIRWFIAGGMPICGVALEECWQFAAREICNHRNYFLQDIRKYVTLQQVHKICLLSVVVVAPLGLNVVWKRITYNIRPNHARLWADSYRIRISSLGKVKASRSPRWLFLKYLLLPPRSAPEAASRRLAPKAASRPPRPPSRRGKAFIFAWYLE